MIEEWRDVVGFSGAYKVSNTGKVWSCKYKKVMALSLHLGYYSVLLNRDGKTYRKRISRLVFEAFVGGIPHGMLVDHIDRDRKNNHVSNLRCVDGYQNQYNRVARRTHKKGKVWEYSTRILGTLYQKSGFATEEDAFAACKSLRDQFVW